MRILAIRGENLASLAGSFELDLTAPPLDNAGIFAITGPTGAGKSTLLDALCVALFDRTPRLSDQGGVELGDGADRLRAHDVRSLLRKGASHGSASVDFIGVDGNAYTASWRVDRGKRNGKLNDQIVSLHPHGKPTELIAGGKTRKRDALIEIERRLGLSFDEFRQAALLAQGDFAAFLKADQKHRASLLERITGTRIYTRLSIKAHERAREERQRIDQLSRDQAGISVLSQEARDALLSEERRLHEVERRVNEESRQIETWMLWYQTLDTLTGSERDAKTSLDDVESRWEALRETRVQVARYRAHQALLPALNRLDETTREESESLATLAQSQASFERHQSQLSQSHLELEASEKIVGETEQLASSLQPELELASRLDGEIAAAQRQHEDAQNTLTRALNEAHEEDQRALQRKADLDAEERALHEAERWISERTDRHELATQWARWSARIDAFVDLVAARSKLDPAAADALVIESERRAIEAAQTHEQSASALLLTQALVDEAERRVLDAERQVSPERRESLHAIERLLHDLEEARARATAAAQAKAEAMEQRRRAQRDVQRSTELQLTATQKRDQAKIELDEAEQRRDQSRLRHELNAVREALHDGAPCPVCGATDHPDRSSSDEVASIHIENEQRVEQVRAELLDRERDVASAKAVADEQRNRVKDREDEASRQTQAQEAATSQYDRILAELNIDDLEGEPTSEGAAEAIVRSRRVIAADLEALQTQERIANTARAEATRARRDRDQARHESETARRLFDDAQRAAEDARRAAISVKTDLDRINQTLDVERAALDPVLMWIPGWETTLSQKRGSFRATCERRVEDYLAKQSEVEERRKSIARLEPIVSAAKARAEALASTAARANEGLALITTRVSELTTTRANTLSGRSTAEVRRDLDDRLRASRERLKLSRTTFDEAQRQLHLAEATLARARLALERASERKTEARKTLDNALVGESEDDVRGVLSTRQEVIDAQQTQLDEVQRSLEAARTVLEERSIRRQQHASQHAPDLSREEVAHRKTSLEIERNDAQQQAREATLRRSVDDDARKRRGELQDRISAQQAVTDLWSFLDALIGSSDGSKFGKFAQGLTLHALVHHANEHLADFARRYQLAPVPGTDLELQIVDREMGDEIRSVGSLSGGETFLVSLSLALALSTLGSRGTQVGTLFIDEGFGTLDLGTLDMAIDALGALQSEGRQIGLISHIPGLAERLGVRVEVAPRGGGRSVVKVIADTAG